jgi:hypothetical protein
MTQDPSAPTTPTQEAPPHAAPTQAPSSSSSPPQSPEGWSPGTSGPPARQSAADMFRSAHLAAQNFGRQMRDPRVQQAARNVLVGIQRAHYFSQAGMGEAFKYTLNPQGYRPRPIVTIRGQRRRGIVGVDPSYEVWR